MDLENFGNRYARALAEAGRNEAENRRVAAENGRVAADMERGEAIGELKQTKAEKSDVNQLLDALQSGELTGPQGSKGDAGAPFAIAQTYDRISAMEDGFASDGVAVGALAMIASSDGDNAKIYVKTSSEYVYVTNLSGAQGIKGETGPADPAGPEPILLWTGSWGANGSPNLIITGLSNYEYIIYGCFAEISSYAIVRTKNNTNQYIMLSTNSATAIIIRSTRISRSGDVLSVSASKRATITSDGTVTLADNADSQVYSIWGCESL